MNKYCMYLRKSRSDAEAEERGEGETLARHEKTLLALAKNLNITISHIYRELVSGETIAARPVMQQLLQEVEQGVWDGVLVMEVERLARGDTIDQGIMAQTFKYSSTKIITPLKTYDPENEYDEEYFEFGLFMSRREYKTINRRLQRGRITSVKEGKYVANKPPYGYERVRLQNDKGWTLSPIENEAEIIRLIFDWYVNGKREADGSVKRLGVSLIVRNLNAMHISSKSGGEWIPASVRDILINPVYIGKIRWNWRPANKKVVAGQVKTSRPRTAPEECIIADGLHPPILSEDIFQKAQHLMAQNPPRPIGEKNSVKNPLSGIVVCGKCGRRLVRRPAGPRAAKDTLMCPVTVCNNVSSALHLVEERVLSGLADWVTAYKLNWTPEALNNASAQLGVKQKALSKLQADLATLNKQLGNMHDLLEQGVYSIDMFIERSRAVSERVEKVQRDIKVLEANINDEIAQVDSRAAIIPKVEELLAVYSDLQTPQAKNDMLKAVINKAVYTKENSTRWHGSKEDFEIVLFPRLPETE